MTKREFIAQIAPIIQRMAPAYGIHVVSGIIAQACLESGYGASELSARYHNFFGIKYWPGHTGKVVNMSTKEEYDPGILTSTRSNFCVYTDIEDAVRGYFLFITRNSRYKNLPAAKTPEEYLSMIKNDGYATSSSYVASTMGIVNAYGLRVWDGAEDATPVSYAGIVTASALRVRTGPSTDYSVAQIGGHDFLLPRGLCVAFEAELYGWAKLSGFDGWCSLDYIQR